MPPRKRGAHLFAPLSGPETLPPARALSAGAASYRPQADDLPCRGPRGPGKDHPLAWPAPRHPSALPAPEILTSKKQTYEPCLQTIAAVGPFSTVPEKMRRFSPGPPVWVCNAAQDHARACCVFPWMDGFEPPASSRRRVPAGISRGHDEWQARAAFAPQSAPPRDGATDRLVRHRRGVFMTALANRPPPSVADEKAGYCTSCLGAVSRKPSGCTIAPPSILVSACLADSAKRAWASCVLGNNQRK